MNISLHSSKFQNLSLGPVIGEGSYGKIYLAEYRTVDGSVPVAVKVLVKDPEIESSQKNEINSLQSLRHANIVKVYEVIETSTHYYIVMELAHGGDLLQKVMDNGPFETAMVKSYFKEIVSAVACCHKSSIAHRDLKLENILLDKDGHVKLTDFGFSHNVEGTALSETFCGSPIYSSPEVLQGYAYDSMKADVWSLGVILYALVFGQFPFDGSNVINMVKSQLSKDIPIPFSVDEDLLDLMSSMMEPNVEKRATITKVLNTIKS